MKRKLTVDDVVKLVRFNEVSPYGGKAAFTITRPDLASNRNITELNIYDGNSIVHVASGRVSTPRWSPSGNLLAYLESMEEQGRRKTVVRVWRLGGQPRTLTSFEHGVTGLEWLDENRLVVAYAEPAKAMHDEDYVATDKAPLWFEGEGLVAGLHYAVGVVDVWSGRLRKLVVEEEKVSNLTVCRGKIYYTTPVSWRNPLSQKVVEVDPATGSRREVVSGYAIESLKCLGTSLYALMHRRERGLATHFKLWRIDEDQPLCLSCGILDRNIWFIAGEWDGKPAIGYADGGRVVIAVVDGSKLEALIDGKMFIRLASLRNGPMFLVYSGPQKPEELYKYDGSTIERVTGFNNWLVEEVELYEPVRVEVEAGGDHVEGWVILPPGGGPHPLILFIHGGPKAMYGYAFYPEMQLMVAHGFAVAYANPRGSDGYSEDFADIRGAYGEKDFEQLIAFLDHVVSRFNIDSSRVGVTGISYGGYMTNIMVAKASSRFRAAVSENGIADWIADYWGSDIGYWFDPDQIGGTPLDNLEEYVRRSPVYMLPEKIETAVMIIHSMEDYRCFIDQALAMHLALLERGAKSRLVVFRRGGHGHSIQAEPRHRRKRLELKLNWFREHLQTRRGG